MCSAQPTLVRRRSQVRVSNQRWSHPLPVHTTGPVTSVSTPWALRSAARAASQEENPPQRTRYRRPGTCSNSTEKYQASALIR